MFIRNVLWYLLGVYAVELGWVLGYLSDKTTPQLPWWAGVIGGVVVMYWSLTRYRRAAPARQENSDPGD